MNDLRVYDNLLDAEARVAAIYMIEALGDLDSPPEWLQDFADDTERPDVKAILDAFPELASVIDMDQFESGKEQAGALIERWCLAGRTGLIVKAEICVRHYHAGTQSFSSSWGNFRWRWFTVDRLDMVVPTVLTLASQQHQNSMAEGSEA
ncbi:MULTISPECIES: hypothetical protein [unclassified Rhizobium]|uniref:hypothetical protein n=1 Tax=unclassified Rhizobium TaxID=2613769 RepID=UPI002478848E|nr:MULTISPECIES: hypothetical protein [unclassified Rhizobium]MDH7802264.1 hypothetical protein [Rhizobium sp. AN70]